MSSPNQAWKALPLDKREIQYSPSSCITGSLDRFLRSYSDQSVAARQECLALGARLSELRYGTQDSHTIDLAIVGDGGVSPAPLLIFFHGGYWQELSKADSFFAAADCIKHGISFAAVDYTLAPSASLDQIVAECRTALATLRDSSDQLAVDPDRIVVSGSSAGGHLAAMVSLGLEDGWRPAGVGLVSGIFDLEPLIGTYINENLGLDVEAARRNSPIRSNLNHFPATVIVYGDNETEEFKRQSYDMSVALRHAEVATTFVEAPDRNHFDVILDLCRNGTALGDATLRLVAQTSTD